MLESLIVIKGWIVAHVPAAIGSALSLYVSREKTANMRKIEIFGVFFAGIAIAHYIGGGAIEYSDISADSLIADSIKMTVGLIGMALVTNIVIQVPLVLSAIRRKWLGE